MENNKLGIASIVLGVISILCSIPGIVLLIIRNAHPDTLINTIITLSIASLISGLTGVLAGASGMTLAIMDQRDAKLIAFNILAIILAAIILLTL